ncbi:sugar ABC transporter substrate-binding protein [Geodermatophilus sp. URMC 62]|uniref:sugar ABC transporter substrate-binding protein n=1 Tax=Geodermatophilus sp. URMC 62 TaxID=3423414 RepID=UPI00406D26A5
MKTRTPWQAALAASAAVLLVAGCSSDSSDSDSGSGGGGGGGGVDLAAAQETIEPLTSPPTEFPITEPLEKLPEPGTVVVYMDNGTPVGAQVYEEAARAAEVLGVELRRVEMGQSPQEINAAMNSVVESKPDAVFDLALDPALFTPQLEALQEQGAVFIPSSIVNGEEFGFDDSQIISGKAGAKANGKVLASAVLAETNGEATNLVFYRVPELAFTPLMQEGVEEQLAEQCPDCELRVVDIPITEVGSTASRTVVSDLQANPDTEAFVASIDELQIGLPAAMDVAGLDVPGMGLASTPINYQQIAAGDQLGGLAADLGMTTWITMDQLARALAGQELDYSFATEVTSPVNYQVITEENVPSDPEAGYVAFPDYQEQFTALWTGE